MQTKEIFSIEGIVAKYTSHVSAKKRLIFSEDYPWQRMSWRVLRVKSN